MLCEELYRELKEKFAFAQEEVESMFKAKVNLDAEDLKADAYNVNLIYQIDSVLSKKYNLEVGFDLSNEKSMNSDEQGNNIQKASLNKPAINNNVEKTEE